ncbi:MAG: aminotransferase class I/II-fold pyridoxal phosphate-dependent enzyme [Acidimicrobiales bacterium]
MTIQYSNENSGSFDGGISGATATEIAASVESAIRGNALRPGDSLPPIRALAAELAVSPTTVSAAYKELTRRGMVIGDGRRGTRVRAAPPISGRLPIAVPSGVIDLRTGGPDPELLPPLPDVRSIMDRAQARYGDPPVSAHLSQVASQRLDEEGVDTTNLTVIGGALDGVERVLGAWLRAGDRVAVEDPGYTAVLDLLGAVGLRPVPVEVDDFGVRPARLRSALERGVEAVILTPRAQNPTGSAWDRQRASELRTVLSEHPGVLVIEDDHAGPAAGVPLDTVCVARTRWATICSVSKWLGPDLRLAILAGDATTVSRVEGRQALGTGWVSHLLQEIVAELWSDPEVARLLEHASTVYSQRRDALCRALGEEGVRVNSRSGLTVWVPVPDEHAVVAGLLGDGIAVSPGERFRIDSPPGVRIACAALAEVDAPRVAASIGAVLNQRAVRTG